MELKIKLKWVLPPLRGYKLNINAARSHDVKLVTGDIIRDHDGDWIQDFKVNMGMGEVIEGEHLGFNSWNLISEKIEAEKCVN